jgi:hypothetical protein
MEERILTYGLEKDSGKLVFVTKVPNGLACNCLCPECQAPLVAKNKLTNKKAPHFAHASGKACVGGGLESAIHLLAKDILLESRRLFTPPYHFDYNINNLDSLYKPGELVRFDEVLLEQKVFVREDEDYFIPDAIGIIKGRQLFIEFARTHFVDEAKKWKLKQSGVASIEIDLRHLSLSREEIQFALEHAEPVKYWLTNPKLDSVYRRELLARKQKEEKKRRKAKEREKQIAEAKKEKDQARVAWLGQQKKMGYQLLKKYAFGYVYCPLAKLKVKELEKSNFGSHPVIKNIIESGQWNGGFYGRGEKRYVFVGSERVEIFWANQSLAEKKSAKFLYAGSYYWTIIECLLLYGGNLVAIFSMR